jgi:hypothetical protein
VASALAVLGGMAVAAMLIASTASPADAPPSPRPRPSAVMTETDAPPTPPPGFPAAEYEVRVTADDRPPSARYLGVIWLALRPDGAFFVDGPIDQAGWYEVDHNAIVFHADDTCRDVRMIGRYRWALDAAGRLRLRLTRLGDQCGDRPWLFTLRAWEPVAVGGT